MNKILFVAILQVLFVQSQSPLLIKSLHVCKHEVELALSTNHRNDEQQNRTQRSNIMQAAVCLHLHNLVAEAMELYDHLRVRFPTYAFPLVNKALIYLKNGDSQNAMENLSLYFDEVGGMFGNSTSNTITDKDAQIVGSPCAPYAVYRSECVNALNFLGVIQDTLLHSPKAAIQSYKRAIEIGSDVTHINNVFQNLGSLYQTLGLYDDAADTYLETFWLTITLEKKVDPVPLIQRAMLVPCITESLRDVVTFKHRFESRIHELIKLIDYGGIDLIEEEKERSDLFKVSNGISSINDIKLLLPLAGSLNYLEQRIDSPHFYLHYFGYHDRPIQELVMTMYDKLRHPSIPYVSMSDMYHYPDYMSMNTGPIVPFLKRNEDILNHTARKRSKIRIVFISSHFGGNEPHGLLLIDVIKQLPVKLFDCHAIGIGPVQPSQMFIDVFSGHYYNIGTNDHKARAILTDLSPDCVVFGEVMNEGLSYFLAQTRYAPIQIILMGAPVTSGFSTIDYFISGDRLEHPFRTRMSGNRSHQEHYSEQVVLFDGQAISFPSNEIHPRQSRTLAQGDALHSINAASNNITSSHMYGYHSITGMPILKNGESSYLCFQNLFKIHPIFDIVLRNILTLDPKGHVVLQAARSYEKTQQVIKRMRQEVQSEMCTTKTKVDSFCNAAENILSRIHFIPRVQSQLLPLIYEQASVALHPFPFGGSKTASDTLKVGTPLITYPQQYLRGRLASTFYTTMALHEVDDHVSSFSCCIATNTTDYITKAVRLGTDKIYHQNVKSAILKRNHRIYDDSQTAFEWSRFICRSLGVKKEGLGLEGDEALATIMNYKPNMWQSNEFIQSEFIKIQKHWKVSHQEEEYDLLT